MAVVHFVFLKPLTTIAQNYIAMIFSLHKKVNFFITQILWILWFFLYNPTVFLKLNRKKLQYIGLLKVLQYITIYGILTALS